MHKSHVLKTRGNKLPPMEWGEISLPEGHITPLVSLKRLKMADAFTAWPPPFSRFSCAQEHQHGRSLSITGLHPHAAFLSTP
jgi:hypothetical protein